MGEARVFHGDTSHPSGMCCQLCDRPPVDSNCIASGSLSSSERGESQGAVYREGGWLADGVMAVCPECRQVLEGTMGWHAQHEKVCDWVPAGTWLKKRVAAERRKWEMSAESGAAVLAPAMSDPIDHPKHYTSHPANIECIAVVEHLGFCVGNAIKYLWRAGLKGDAIEDLKKARWYVDREIARRSSPSGSGAP